MRAQLISSVDARYRGRLGFVCGMGCARRPDGVSALRASSTRSARRPPALPQGEFLRVIELQQARARHDDDGDMVDAFVACGGRPDRSGVVQRETLVRIIKVDFGLTFDIERLLDEQDGGGGGGGGGDGALDFAAFKALLLARAPGGSAGGAARRPS